MKGLYIQIKTYALIGIFLSEQKKKLHEHAQFFLSFLFYYENGLLFLVL